MSKIELIRDELDGSVCRHITHDTGLHIYVKEMPGFTSTHALFATHYGSLNNCFRVRGEAEFSEVPEGIAHFLEHKLSENEDCDAFELYAQTGADANAYTTFDHTAYLFDCTENVYDSLRILLNTVQNPYFTKENVDKEMGIIEQEIRMGLDNVGSAEFYGLLGGLYHTHPVRIQIAGSVESIHQIDADLLYRCYHAFYDLHNMALCIAGNVETEKVLAICDELLRPGEDMQVEQRFADEPDTVAADRVDIIRPIKIPVFTLGFKLPPRPHGIEQRRAELCARLLFETLFNNSAPVFNEMLEEGLINYEFGSDGAMCGDGYLLVSVSGETERPEAVRDRVFAEIRRAKAEGFDRDCFERVKRVAYGRIIRGLCIPEAEASSMMLAWMLGTTPGVSHRILEALTYEDALAMLRDEIDLDKTTLCVVHQEEAAHADDQ